MAPSFSEIVKASTSSSTTNTQQTKHELYVKLAEQFKGLPYLGLEEIGEAAGGLSPVEAFTVVKIAYYIGLYAIENLDAQDCTPSWIFGVRRRRVSI
jgi:hypothetical protein